MTEQLPKFVLPEKDQQPSIWTQKIEGDTVLSVITRHYAPAAFLCWATYGIFRPVFDAHANYSPIFWYVGGACLLTLVERYVTRDIDDDGEGDDMAAYEAGVEERWRFGIKGLSRVPKKKD